MTLLRQSTFRRSLFGPSAALLLAACSDGATAPKPIDHLPRELTSAEQVLISQSNDFAFSLFHEVDSARQTPDANTFISPLSASMALGMTMNGAAGSTLDAMRATLDFSAMSLADVDASYQSLITLLRGLDPSVDFQIANSIWYRQDFPFEASFLASGQTYFDAKIQALDFNDPTAPATINSWVSESTNGKIDKMIDQISPQDVMYLLNAIYFKGSWQHAFDKAKTSSRPFFLADGSTFPVETMHLPDATFPAGATATYQAAELPYGGGAYAMVVVVPNEGTTLDDVIASMDASAWQALLSSFTQQTGDVYLPRFRLDWGASLKGPLAALGMGIAFQCNAADFTGLSSTRGHELCITSVDQKTFVDVNEEGTEAAAVTSVGLGATSVPPPLINADRPFLFAIRERLSGTILFIGAVRRPR